MCKMAIRIPNSDQSRIYIGTQEIGAVYVGANKVWPDTVASIFQIVHNKQTNFTVYFTCSTYNTVTINWGDGSSFLISGAGNRVKTYASPGTYTVTITGDLTKITAFRCNTQQASELQFHPDCYNITEIQAYANSFSSLDISMCTKILTLYSYNNSSLTNLTMPISVSTSGNRSIRLYSTGITSFTMPSGVTAISDFLCYSCNSITSVNLGSVVTATGQIMIYSCGALTSFNLNSLTTSVTIGIFNNNLLTSASFPALTSIGSGNVLGLYNDPLLTSVSIPLLTTANTISFYKSPIGAITITSLTTIASLNIQSCGLSQAQVDSYLSQCVTISNTDTSCNLQLNNSYGAPNNSTPSAGGLANKATLVARGWSVSNA
jgi:hypothetical protein